MDIHVRAIKKKCIMQAHSDTVLTPEGSVLPQAASESEEAASSSAQHAAARHMLMPLRSSGSAAAAVRRRCCDAWTYGRDRAALQDRRHAARRVINPPIHSRSMWQ